MRGPGARNVTRSEGDTDGPPARPEPSPEVSAAIQRRIDALRPVSIGNWPLRVFKEELNALPLHGSSALYVWGIRPDGSLIRLDLDAVARVSEVENDARIRFAVMVQGAARYPELVELIPPPPAGARLYDPCGGTGRIGEGDALRDCVRCDGFGWYVVGA